MLKKIILFLISIVESVAGILAIAGLFELALNKGDQSNSGLIGIIACCVVTIGICILLMKMRDISYWFAIPEFFLSPLGLLRVIVGFIIAHKKTYNDFEVEANFGDNHGENFIQFIFYVDDSSFECSPVVNFFYQLFVSFPLTIAMGACFWFPAYVIWKEKPKEIPVTLILICVFLLSLLSMLFGTVKTTSVTVEYRTHVTRFENKRTGESVYLYGNKRLKDPSKSPFRYSSNFSSSETYHDTPHLSALTTLGFIFSPVLAVTQAVGVIVSFISIFVPHVYSSYGFIDFTEAPLKYLQAPLYFLSSFVID